MTNNVVATVNAGSSSIKLAVFAIGPDMLEMSRLLDVSINNIGQPVSTLRVMHMARVAKVEEIRSLNYTAAADLVLQRVAQTTPTDAIIAIGHRLVHGGGVFTQPTLTKDIAEADWTLLSEIDPQHTPLARQLITRSAQHFPSIPQIACFDTTFFNELPQTAKVIPIPKEFYKTGIRHYGFHGLSYTSLLETFQEKAGDTAVNGRVVLAHLGSGASLAAVQHGKPIDTTMGFTPASGIPMSTRSGDLDPGIFGFLSRRNDMTGSDFDHMVNFESGLLGISGVSGDMEQLLRIENEKRDAALAIDVFVWNVKKSIGAFAAVLGGIDSLIFSGGIGEQSAVLRTRICEGLEYLGIKLDSAANEGHSFLISSPSSKAGVHVIPTDEARVIARQTIEQLNKTHEDKG